MSCLDSLIIQIKSMRLLFWFMLLEENKFGFGFFLLSLFIESVIQNGSIYVCLSFIINVKRHWNAPNSNSKLVPAYRITRYMVLRAYAHILVCTYVCISTVYVHALLIQNISHNSI